MIIPPLELHNQGQKELTCYIYIIARPADRRSLYIETDPTVDASAKTRFTDVGTQLQQTQRGTIDEEIHHITVPSVGQEYG